MNISQNELTTELVGIHGLNSFSQFNSSSRSVMFASHFGQHLVIDGAETKRIQTGVEREFGKYTFSVKMPEDGRIIKIIDKFPQGIDKDSIGLNPETLVIYENEHTKEIDYFSIPYYFSYHQFFGYKFKIKEAISKLRVGAFIPKGTIFADSPAVGDNSDYMYGTNANVAYMSIPSVAEDGFMVSESFIKKLKFKVYETRVVEFGANKFPLNLYGNPNEYKSFPDVGDYVRDDGLLMMLREYDENTSPVDMSIYDTMEPDFISDKGVYVRVGKGKVIDIQIVSNNSQRKNLPRTMCAQMDKYNKAIQKYYHEIIDIDRQLRMEKKKKYGDSNIDLTPKFHRLVVEALAITNHDLDKHKQPLRLLNRKSPIDEYRVVFTIEYEVDSKIGYKITGSSGDKGTIVKVEKDENMPVDAEGNRADIVMDAASVISRMNIGKLYEHYFNGLTRDIRNRLRNYLGVTNRVRLEFIQTHDKDKIKYCLDTLIDLYKTVSIRQYNYYSQCTPSQLEEHLLTVINDDLLLYLPVEKEKHLKDIVKECEAKFTPCYGPVSYIGNSGIRCTTKKPIRIAPMYIMLLEKITDEWSAVATGNLHHFGILTQITKGEKFTLPYRNSPVRTVGETEGRLFVGYTGRESLAEMMDKSNNPVTQRNVVWNILNAVYPSNIPQVVDRSFVPLGGIKTMQMVGHMFRCHGFRTVYEPETI
jgi:hypothetical protein